jgi:hypothetical protein
MRNLFLIITFSILLTNYGYTKDIPKKYLDKDYIFKADKKIRWTEKTGGWGKPETHDRLSQNPWNLRYETGIIRDGKYSFRFEMRDGDCHSGDCPRGKKKGLWVEQKLVFISHLIKNIEVIMVKFGMLGRCICLKTHHT